MGGVNQQRWTVQELAVLRSNAHHGVQVVAALLGRTEGQVRRCAQRNRISLRRPGETRGMVMGQRVGERWSEALRSGVAPERLEAIRQDVQGRVVDMATLERKARDAVYGKPRPVCPACGQRPIERQQTGLCEVCHWRELARAHRDEADRIEARRALDAARQEKSRASRGL